MTIVLASIAVGMVVAMLGVYAVARTEIKDGRPLGFSWRLGLASVQAYISTWAVVQIAAGQVFAGAPFDERTNQLVTFLRRLTMAGLVGWAPFAIATLTIALLAARRGDRDAMFAPLVAAAIYAVALMALFTSGWLTGPIG
ncbi:hypothetical protein [Engelhardtia mirabilis]|uniref:Uncharacterized protein n=1 Tax=Engelhardtia mirabilis TaxID=2528011 RepID=A0A518BIJ7_9BACT|nr:hypothetical protein Pla133_18680 [Planctomycetes bacterium Pla133]QDV01118.1 hypothetical protein Pla86_18670 [Planctomycetes bacterium Pla86]